MDIYLESISKRYSGSWVIKNLDMTIHSGEKWAIKGKNGSGKSTLIQLISGVLAPSKGKISYQYLKKPISKDDIFGFLSIHAAYTELDEELTATEVFEHFKCFNKCQITDNEEFMRFSEFANEKNRPLKAFSSGMKQRFGLSLVINSTRPLLLLDEPGSFLDDYWKSWFIDRLKSHASEKTMIIASNEMDDLRLCDREYILN